MKLLNIFAILSLLTLSAVANDYVVLKEEMKVESFSSAVIPLPKVSYIGRLELRIKRADNLFNSKDGLLRIMADGVEVDCIQFYSTTSRKWRSYVVNVGRTVRTLEIYNGLDRKVKIKRITTLPSPHHGRVYHGNPSEVLDLTSQLIDVTTYLTQLVDSNDITALNQIKISAATLMNKVEVLGPLKVTNEINDLLALFVTHSEMINNLKTNQITMDLANEMSFVETSLRRLID